MPCSTPHHNGQSHARYYFAVISDGSQQLTGNLSYKLIIIAPSSAVGEFIVSAPGLWWAGPLPLKSESETGIGGGHHPRVFCQECRNRPGRARSQTFVQRSASRFSRCNHVGRLARQPVQTVQSEICGKPAFGTPGRIGSLDQAPLLDSTWARISPSRMHPDGPRWPGKGSICLQGQGPAPKARPAEGNRRNPTLPSLDTGRLHGDPKVW